MSVTVKVTAPPVGNTEGGEAGTEEARRLMRVPRRRLSAMPAVLPTGGGGANGSNSKKRGDILVTLPKCKFSCKMHS